MRAITNKHKTKPSYSLDLQGGGGVLALAPIAGHQMVVTVEGFRLDSWIGLSQKNFNKS